MTVYFSKSTNGFYVPDIHGEKLPADAIAISTERHKELLIAQANGLQVVADESGAPIAINPPLASASSRRRKSKDAVDRAAGAARLRFVSPGDLVDQEYREAENQAQAFKDGGYAEPSPTMVQSWANAAGMTAQEAADNILMVAQDMRSVLETVRDLRLAGKAAITNAAETDIETVAQSYIAQLDALQP